MLVLIVWPSESLLSPLDPFLIWLNLLVLVLSNTESWVELGVGRMGMAGEEEL
jgi:hypothetical protein